MIYEVLFVMFALGALGFHLFSLLDSYKNLKATRYAKRNLPRLWRPEQEVAAYNSVRNEAYRLGAQAVIVTIALLMSWTDTPRSPELIGLITMMATVVAAILFIAAIHEWVRRRHFLKLFEIEQERKSNERK